MPVLVGASLGGLSALAAIGESSTQIAKALVLVDITTHPNPVGSRRIHAFMRTGVDGFATIEDAADAVASYLPSRTRSVDLGSLRKNIRLRADGRWRWHWDPRFLGVFDTSEGARPGGHMFTPERVDAAARRVALPTLLIRGAASDIVGEENVEHLRECIPHLSVVEVPDAGHMVAGDRNDRFTAAVLEFLTTQRGT
jgi:pimeloyl-ACP methyl ester carboxylesterase